MLLKHLSAKPPASRLPPVLIRMRTSANMTEASRVRVMSNDLREKANASVMALVRKVEEFAYDRRSLKRSSLHWLLYWPSFLVA
ncbi:hypothetical protein KC326_g51 [Hortaea werneckii]|nr:hypothetical protein KC326_g51 [Hortaea werneckii]